MENILLIGNGFDLAHNLQTKYGDFLEVIKDWIYIYPSLEKEINNDIINRLFCQIKKDNIKKFDEIIQNNSWVNYFKQCAAEIDGWIDFEKEILPVTNLFKTIFSINDYSITGNDTYAQAHIPKKYFKRIQ